MAARSVLDAPDGDAHRDRREQPEALADHGSGHSLQHPTTDGPIIKQEAQSWTAGPSAVHLLARWA
jgi:hypothetical protein